MGYGCYGGAIAIICTMYNILYRPAVGSLVFQVLLCQNDLFTCPVKLLLIISYHWSRHDLRYQANLRQLRMVAKIFYYVQPSRLTRSTKHTYDGCPSEEKYSYARPAIGPPD
jgi:hypothetical protein